MPEPPTAFDLSGFSGDLASAVDYPLDQRVLLIKAGTGNVPPGGTVRATNLDDTSPVVAGPGNAQGGFEVDLIISDGQELRLEWVNGDEHSAPADVIISRPDPLRQDFRATVSPRFACLKLTPGFALDFNGSHATLGVENACAGVISFSNAQSRLGLADFALPLAVPADVASGESAEIGIDFTRGAAGLREDVLFLDVTLSGETIRYPITLRAE
jgi:hypothetical protein